MTSDSSKLSRCCRCIIAAVDVWELDDVRWIFEPENTEEVKAHGKTLTKFREDSTEHTVFLQTALALKTPGLTGDMVFQGLTKGSKELEERRVPRVLVA